MKTRMLKSLLSVVIGFSAMTLLAEDKEQNGTQNMTVKFPFYAQNWETLKSMKPFRIPQTKEYSERYASDFGIDGKTDDEKFGHIKDLISRYPMTIKLMDPRFVVLRLASEPTMLLPDNSWVSGLIPKNWVMTITDYDKAHGYLMKSAFLIEKEDESQKVEGLLHLLSNSSTALGVKFLTTMNKYMGYSRMSTMPRSKDDGGYPPIPVKDASFVADFALGDGETPSIAWAIGNLGGGFHLRGGETGTKRLLGGMASRASGLFDVPPADVKHVVPDGLSIVLSTEGKTHRIKVETPKSGPYSDWWLRIDTNVG